MTTNEILLILGMALITFGIRYPMLVLVGRVELPHSVINALKFVPVAVLTAICVPGVLYPKGDLWIDPRNAWLIAGVITIVVSWRTKNLLLTILVGMGSYLALRAVLGV
jgi:branched-subunit amino acid transport protein